MARGATAEQKEYIALLKDNSDNALNHAEMVKLTPSQITKLFKDGNITQEQADILTEFEPPEKVTDTMLTDPANDIITYSVDPSDPVDRDNVLQIVQEWLQTMPKSKYADTAAVDAQLDKVDTKQDRLTVQQINNIASVPDKENMLVQGNNIIIDRTNPNAPVISSTGGSGGISNETDPVYTSDKPQIVTSPFQHNQTLNNMTYAEYEMTMNLPDGVYNVDEHPYDTPGADFAEIDPFYMADKPNIATRGFVGESIALYDENTPSAILDPENIRPVPVRINDFRLSPEGIDVIQKTEADAQRFEMVFTNNPQLSGKWFDMGLNTWGVIEPGYDPVGTNYWLHESGNWAMYFLSDTINGGLAGTENYWFIRDINLRHDPWGSIDVGIGLYEQRDGIGTAPVGSNPDIPVAWTAVTGISSADTSTRVFVQGVMQGINWVNMFGRNLTQRVNSLENLGRWIYTFDTYALIQRNMSYYQGLTPPSYPTANDFINVRNDENQGGYPTRYIIRDINTSTGAITFGFDLRLSADILGKADKVTSATNGNLAGLNEIGNLTDSGISPTTIQTALDARALLSGANFSTLQQNGNNVLTTANGINTVDIRSGYTTLLSLVQSVRAAEISTVGSFLSTLPDIPQGVTIGSSNTHFIKTYFDVLNSGVTIVEITLRSTGNNSGRVFRRSITGGNWGADGWREDLTVANGIQKNISIENGTDINTLRETGLYTIESDGVAGTLINLPSIYRGVIFVQAGNDFVRQEYKYARTIIEISGTYTRTYRAGAWSEWREELTSTNGLINRGQITRGTMTTLSTLVASYHNPAAIGHSFSISSSDIPSLMDLPSGWLQTGSIYVEYLQLAIGNISGMVTIRHALNGNSAIRSLGTITTTPAWTTEWKCDDIYSSTETLTGGTWIDGKPIYRRVFTGNIVAEANAVTSTILISSGVSSLVNFGGSIQLGWASFIGVGTAIGGTSPPFPQLDGVSSVFISGQGLSLHTVSGLARAGTANNAYQVWIEYTKT